MFSPSALTSALGPAVRRVVLQQVRQVLRGHEVVDADELDARRHPGPGGKDSLDHLALRNCCQQPQAAAAVGLAIRSLGEGWASQNVQLERAPQQIRPRIAPPANVVFRLVGVPLPLFQRTAHTTAHSTAVQIRTVVASSPTSARATERQLQGGPEGRWPNPRRTAPALVSVHFGRRRYRCRWRDSRRCRERLFRC
jgi:hypothetical protein